MKTIIASDLDKDKKSIIPYGLNIGKHTETRVEILHFVDPALVQGTYSPFSDSQSVTPGEKLSHEEILKRNKDQKERDLDKLLSKEASRLNFPLRYHATVEIKETEEGLSETFEGDEDSLIVTGTEPSETSLKNLHDLLNFMYEKNNLLLVIPQGTDFVKPDRATIITNYLDDDFSRMEKVISYIQSFEMVCNAVSLQVEEEDPQQHDKRIEWKKKLKSLAGDSFTDKAEVVTGKDHLKTLQSFIENENTDMLIMSKNKKTTFGHLFFEKEHAAEYIDSVGKPVLFY
ncbi:MAG: hypothetical protein ACOC2E_09620 [Bacteroidota bacterium]